MKIQFISSKSINSYGTTQLRCIQPATYLYNQGAEVSVGNIREASPIWGGVIFFHRLANNRFTRAYLNLARARGNCLIYDTDDLTVGDSAGWCSWRNCDAISVSTDYLKSICSAKNLENTFILRNALSDDYLKLAEKIHDKSGGGKKYVTLGYLSGSSTHDDDFMEIQDVLLKTLDTSPQVRLLLVGKISFSEKFQAFKDRFEYFPFLPYLEYVNLYSRIDVNLAPLVVGSDFNHCKSELKYIEAGACGVPTIASATDTYLRSILDGENGLLARDLKGWHSALTLLIEDVGLRRRLGGAAREDVLANYNQEIRGEQYFEFVQHVSQNTKQSRSIVLSCWYSLQIFVFRNVARGRLRHSMG